eukprot:1159597-Pelagomonas_calceolata.AAC.9
MSNPSSPSATPADNHCCASSQNFSCDLLFNPTPSTVKPIPPLPSTHCCACDYLSNPPLPTRMDGSSPPHLPALIATPAHRAILTAASWRGEGTGAPAQPVGERVNQEQQCSVRAIMGWVDELGEAGARSSSSSTACRDAQTGHGSSSARCMTMLLSGG